MATEYAVAAMPARTRVSWRWPEWSWRRLSRRVRAIGRLVGRGRCAGQRFGELQHLDERTLRDLGVTRSEIASIVSELGGRAEAIRRRTDYEVWSSTSSRFRVRAIDSFL